MCRTKIHQTITEVIKTLVINIGPDCFPESSQRLLLLLPLSLRVPGIRRHRVTHSILYTIYRQQSKQGSGRIIRPFSCPVSGQPDIRLAKRPNIRPILQQRIHKHRPETSKFQVFETAQMQLIIQFLLKLKDKITLLRMEKSIFLQNIL